MCLKTFHGYATIEPDENLIRFVRSSCYKPILIGLSVLPLRVGQGGLSVKVLKQFCVIDSHNKEYNKWANLSPHRPVRSLQHTARLFVVFHRRENDNDEKTFVHHIAQYIPPLYRE